MRRMPEDIPNRTRHQPCVVWLGFRCPETRGSTSCASRHRRVGRFMRRIVFAALVIAACTNDATQPTTVGLSFSVVSGDGQSGVVGQPLPNPLEFLGLVATVEAYNPPTNSWTTKASMPTPRAYLGAAAIDGVIYAAGGQGDESFFVSNVEAYNPSLDTWTVRAPLPTGRLGLGAEVVNGQLYAIGGYGAGYYEGRTTVEAYDAASNTWTALPPMPVGRWFLATTVLNGVIYIIGGSGGVEVVETFRP